MEQDELRRLEDQCIQERAPACAAACPVHMDARAMATEAAKGNFAAAAKIFRKAVPFPGIVSRVCDHPCQEVCKRREAGDAVSIRGIERACLDWAGTAREKVQRLPAKAKRVGIVGGGLSGLTAAFDLARKGFAVTVFEREGRLGGSLWRISEADLPRDVLEMDLRVLEEIGVEIRLGVTVGVDVPPLVVPGDFDALYLAPGVDGGPLLELHAGPGTADAIDPATFTTLRPGVFAGGSLLRGAAGKSPIQSMGDGRRAAISIDRFLQGVSVTAARADEGSYVTRLYTRTEGIEPLPAVPVPEGRGYSEEEASREAARCIRCECMECVKVCEYLHAFGAYPKKYVRQVYNNLSIVMGHRHANILINSCSLCGLCKEVCPEDLHMGLVCKAAREVLVKQGKMPPSAHDFPLRDMQFSNGELCALARHQPGKVSSAFLFFPGCQLAASSPKQVKAVYGLLSDRLSGGVGILLRCCGAPAEWSGRTELFSEVFAELAETWRSLGEPEIIAACSTCHEVLKAHLPEASVVSLWEVLDRLGLPDEVGAEWGRTVAVHDPCATRHREGIQASVRNILARTGIRVEELPLSRDLTECCGYGGLMFFGNRDLARKVIERRAGESPLDYVAYCAMCRDYLAHTGKRVPHLLDLVFGVPWDEAAGRRGPGYSMRHENRVRLKRRLLKELWGEEMTGKEPGAGIRLRLSDKVAALIEDRLILEEDLRAVLEYAETTGNRLMNRATGRYLAHHKPAAVTYWVDYSKDGGEYVIHNAYSHRMEIAEDVKP